MNRLVRIALTLFASATILVLLVRQRLQRLKGLGDEAAEEFVRSESQMALVGLILAGLLAVIGFILIIVSIGRGRRRANQALSGDG